MFGCHPIMIDRNAEYFNKVELEYIFRHGHNVFNEESFISPTIYVYKEENTCNLFPFSPKDTRIILSYDTSQIFGKNDH